MTINSLILTESPHVEMEKVSFDYVYDHSTDQ